MSDLVLFVEDSVQDVEAVRRALRRTHPAVHLEHLPSGEGVVARLTAGGLTRPRLLLLDLNLAGLSGIDVLRAVRAESSLDDLPVVVLTSSTNPRDVDACYAAGASSYLVKSVNFTLMRGAIANAVDYWIGSHGEPEG
ncbi:response regulator [Dactylosporangium sp. CS-047395]|uniref:response regulator n=1 Tax=Dactylosporangium sp. CS-047395 TaxID=3239936 RepID=UPI003D8DD950